MFEVMISLPITTKTTLFHRQILSFLEVIESFDLSPFFPIIIQFQGGLPEIYAFGLRNPWRCDFALLKGEAKHSLICADVGQSKWEEITVIREPGENHGWKLFEGLGMICYY